jgi:anti-sigma factor RsiW
MSAAEMDCRELVELVTEYLEGTLSRADHMRFEAHLAGCRYCVTYLQQMRQVIQAMGRLSEESITEPARQELLRAFRDWKRGR